MSSNGVLWITTIIMAVGGLLILVTGKRRTSAEFLQTTLHGIVPLIAACLYFAMATGQGLVVLPTDTAVRVGTHATRVFYYARYIDWTFTTPLLLLSLGLTSMHRGPKLAGALLGAALADVIMILTAFAFGASEVDWMKWTWFIISCAAFLAVYYVIWVPQVEANRSERADVQQVYRRSAMALSVVWLVYPFILAVSPDGMNMVSDVFAVTVIAVLDVVAKVIYGFAFARADARITDGDLAEITTTTTGMRRAA